MYKFFVFGPPRPNHNKPNEILKKLNEHQEETKGKIKNTHPIHPATSQYTFIRFVCSDRLVHITTNAIVSTIIGDIIIERFLPPVAPVRRRGLGFLCRPKNVDN